MTQEDQVFVADVVVIHPTQKTMCRNPSLELATKAMAYKGVNQE
jgi:hypothetical protein